MARKPKLYQKLARRRGAIGTYFSLWLASDHVLQVEANTMTERYQRVWLRDIQGFMLRPSRQARWVSFTGLGLLAASATAAVMASSAMEVFVVFACIAAVVLLYGLLGARTCHFHVVTAVQCAKWPNIARLGQARKTIARLEPLILSAQAGDAATTEGGAADVSVNA